MSGYGAGNINSGGILPDVIPTVNVPSRNGGNSNAMTQTQFWNGVLSLLRRLVDRLAPETFSQGMSFNLAAGQSAIFQLNRNSISAIIATIETGSVAVYFTQSLSVDQPPDLIFNNGASQYLPFAKVTGTNVIVYAGSAASGKLTLINY